MNNPTPITSYISPWLMSIIYPLSRKVVIAAYFGQITVTGRENIPKEGPLLIAPTHRARWDALMVPYAVGRHITGRDAHYMVTASEVKGFQGWFIRRLGGFPVDVERLNPEPLRHSVELLTNGEMLVIFPEAGIFRDQPVQKLKRGVALIALEAQEKIPETPVNILPISIKYDSPFPKRGSKIHIKIGVPINVAEYQEGSLRKNSQKLTTDLYNSLHNLHDQPQLSNLTS